MCQAGSPESRREVQRNSMFRAECSNAGRSGCAPLSLQNRGSPPPAAPREAWREERRRRRRSERRARHAERRGEISEPHQSKPHWGTQSPPHHIFPLRAPHARPAGGGTNPFSLSFIGSTRSTRLPELSVPGSRGEKSLNPTVQTPRAMPAETFVSRSARVLPKQFLWNIPRAPGTEFLSPSFACPFPGRTPFSRPQTDKLLKNAKALPPRATGR